MNLTVMLCAKPSTNSCRINTEMTNNSKSQREIIDQYFLEHRAKVLDIAAFLDRVDRCKEKEEDFRIDALRDSIKELLSSTEGRTERILLLLSDQTKEPVDCASTKGASGAVPPKS